MNDNIVINDELWVLGYKNVQKERVSRLKDEFSMMKFDTKVRMNTDKTWNIYYKPNQYYRSE